MITTGGDELGESLLGDAQPQIELIGVLNSNETYTLHC
jgi:hypothetical protein